MSAPAPGEAGRSAGAPAELRVLVTDADGKSFISGTDFALAFVDEIEQGRHRRERFTVAY